LTWPPAGGDGMTALPTLVVVFDRGAVTLSELATLDDVAEILFAVPGSDYAARLRPVLTELGTVVTLTGDSGADAARIRRHHPAGIVTFSDPMLRVTAGLAAALGLPYHHPHTAMLLTDKYLQRERLRGAGVDSARCRRVSGADDWWSAVAEVGLPAVVKPAWGAGSRDTWPVADVVAAKDLAAELFAGSEPRGGMVLEEYLPGRDLRPAGDYVGVESVCMGHRVEHIAITGKFPLEQPFREVGQYWPSVIGADEASGVMRLATDALRALDVRTGFVHTEVKLGLAGPRIIEVNGRMAGDLHQYATQACSADLVRAACRLALDADVRLPPLHPEGVFFQYTSLGPTRPCRLEAVHGARTVRGTDGVAGYRSVVRPGQRLPGGVMTDPMDFLWGRAADHTGMFDVLDLALSALSFEFSLGDAERVVVEPPRPWAAEAGAL